MGQRGIMKKNFVLESFCLVCSGGMTFGYNIQDIFPKEGIA